MHFRSVAGHPHAHTTRPSMITPGPQCFIVSPAVGIVCSEAMEIKRFASDVRRSVNGFEHLGLAPSIDLRNPLELPPITQILTHRLNDVASLVVCNHRID